jgi:hypothetical protein
MKKKYIYIFFIFFFVLWTPVHDYLFPYDGRNRIISVLGILFLLIGLKKLDKNFIREGKYFDIPFIIWVVWVIIDTLLFKPIINPEIDYSVFFVKAILPIIIYFGIRLNFSKFSLKSQWYWYYVPLLITLIMIFIFEENSEEFPDRLGNYMNPNEIAWLALLTLFSSFIYSGGKYLRYFTISITFILILLTASKKALLSFVFFFTLKFLFFGKMPFIKRFSISMVFLLSLYLVTPIIIKNTVIGERIMETIEDSNKAEDDSELFDGRAKYYINGMELFKNNPITGIGITNFYYLGDMDLEAHSEYVVQLVELGPIAFLLFLFIHINILVSLIKMSKKKSLNKTASILLISFLVFYGMFLGRWVYDHIVYHIYLALTVNTIVSSHRKLDYKIKTLN